MKKTLLRLLLIMSLPAFLQAEVRKFTDTSGREIQAELVAVRGDQVEMNVGGKEFTLPISKFVEADATFIKEWGAANPAPLNIRGLHVQIKKNTDKVKEAKPASGAKGKGDDSKTSKTNFEYQITVQNSSTEDLPDMKLKYTIYKLFFPSSFIRNREKLKIQSQT